MIKQNKSNRNGILIFPDADSFLKCMRDIEKQFKKEDKKEDKKQCLMK